MAINVRDLPSLSDLIDAISRQAIEPAFQPLVDLEQAKTIGFEVLARWNHPTLGAVNPAAFIKLAEDNGLINPLTQQVIEKACKQVAALGDETVVAFNLSPVQFRDETIVDLVRDCVAGQGIPFSRVHIELTESALIDDEGTAIRVARKLKEIGFCLSLDDFGTGFSSLTRLHSLPFDKLKIDASFVRRMEDDAASRKIVASVIDLGQSLGMMVVAEGVETAAQLAMLRRLGCEVGQGFFLGRPSLRVPQVNLAYPVGSFRCSRLNPSRRQKLFQLEAIYRNSPNALAFPDCDGRIVHANQRFSDVAEKTGLEVVGHSSAGLFPANRRACIARILDHLVRGREINQLELSRTDQGKTFIASCTRVVDDEAELIGISLALIDVTRRKNAETLLKADGDQFRRIADRRLHVIWAARPTGEVYYMGPTLSSGGGVVIEERLADWYVRMHPDDRVRVRQEWLAWLPSGRPFLTTFRIRDLSGAWRLVTSSASPSLREDGSIEDWLGVISESIDSAPR